MGLLANLLLACLLTSALIQNSKAQGGISIYWGTNGSDDYDEKSLAETCETGLYSIVNVGSVFQFGNGLDIGIYLSNHCDPDTFNCTHVAEHVKICQKLGVKVFISLGGVYGIYLVTSPSDAFRVAEQLWNTFLGGNDSSTTRPFGDAVFDGVDFNLFGVDTDYHDFLARYLKNYSEQGTKPVYLSIAPQCPYPDDYLGNVIGTGVFDYVWVQFYQTFPYRNATCEYTTKAGADNLLSTWNTWTSSFKGSEKLFLGLPASTNASFTGYVPADALINQILPEIKDKSRYGGVMLWNRYYDIKSNYSSSIVNHVNLELIRLKTD